MYQIYNTMTEIFMLGGLEIIWKKGSIYKSENHLRFHVRSDVENI